jgi:threonine/homoserine/homoserine lactone efflux protein
VREYLFIGVGFGVAAALQPGPLQAFLFSRVTRAGWIRTLPAAFAPVISDTPIAALVLLVISRVPPGAQGLLQAAGGILLLYFARAAYREWRDEGDAQRQEQVLSAPRTLAHATAINILNPNPYLGWSLVLGPEAIKAWHEAPAHALLFIAAFYGTMVLMIALTIAALGATRFLTPGARRALVLVSAVLLAAVGLFQVVSGGSHVLRATRTINSLAPPPLRASTWRGTCAPSLPTLPVRPVS